MLNGWKEIAAYIGREQRTAVRWAIDRGMPVHRAPGQGRGTVYALPDEIDLWLAKDREKVSQATRASLFATDDRSEPARNDYHCIVTCSVAPT